jgi:hypothetical protein
MLSKTTAPIRKARKLHTCSFCKGIIFPGDAYQRGASMNLDTKEIYTEKVCSKCMAGDYETPPHSINKFTVWREPDE